WRPLLPLPDEGQTASQGRVVQVENAAAADDPVGRAIAGAARVAAVQGGQTLGDLGPDSLALAGRALAREGRDGKRETAAGARLGRADAPLVGHGLGQTAARHLARRLVIPAAARTFGSGIFGWYGVLAYGLYPLRQYGERDASLRGLVRLVQAGNALLIFP